MKKEIVDFVKQACVLYNMTAIYLPDNDCYVISKKGKAIQNFDTNQFYQIPKARRMKDYRALINGLNHNLGERYKEQTIRRKLGIKIY